ncbi:IS607 family transposase [Endozoicomonas sp. ONNA2]|uniref:IS607 family transposase n=1 Tax=Endozoicomonas sp. ONNA2 TaxID=2828741 RepID=UPI00214951E2|nr:IS607 family transposase [Endozoicomonas sp. ONNA2]
MNKRLVKIGEAARLLGTDHSALRKWESTGELLPARKTKGGTRYYDVAELMGFSNEAAPTLCYCRVSSHDQKADLDRQQELLEAYCSAKGWRTQVIRDLGSGMNYRKKGLNLLLELIMKRQIKRLVLSHKDRLLRFSAELVFSLCDIQGIEIIIIHNGDQPSFEGADQPEELADDVLEPESVRF